MEKIPIGISSCLLGERVRFDAGHKKHAFVNNVLNQFFDFVGFCPEVDIGLGIPRETIRLVSVENEIRCVGTKTPELDVTEELYESAEKQKEWHQQLCGYILKKDSPSCGMERVRLYTSDMPERVGTGLYAKRLMQNFPHLPIEEEGRLGDAVLRENFIQRVYIYWRWKNLMAKGINLHELNHFHATHKYIMMSHDQNQTRALGHWLGENHKMPMEELAQEYLPKIMAILCKRATRKNHTNTLQHIQGYLKKHLESDDRQELADNIHQYREGLVPLIVPITLLRHHFRKHPNQYITDSYYMEPHPGELMLLNSL